MKVAITSTVDYDVFATYEKIRKNTRSHDINEMMKAKIKEHEKKAAKKTK